MSDCQQLSTQLQQKLGIVSPSPVHALQASWITAAQVKVYVKRDDLLHQIISGNKWRKLKYALLAASQRSSSRLVTFGGGHSNHVHALAYGCRALELPLTAIIRGDYRANMTPMLNDIADWGCDIKFVDKTTYQQRQNPSYLAKLARDFPNSMVIPEGGSDPLAMHGLAEIRSELVDQQHEDFDYILAPCASGGTLAGLSQAFIGTHTQIQGIAVLKGQGYLESLVAQLLENDGQQPNWHIDHQYHFGGYAKRPVELIDWCNDFSQQFALPLEPIYSGKLFYALQDKVGRGHYPKGSRILALHTGGLQGARSV